MTDDARLRAHERQLLEDFRSGVPDRQVGFLEFIHEGLRRTCLFFFSVARASGPSAFAQPEELYNHVVQVLLARARTCCAGWDGERPLAPYAMSACRHHVMDHLRSQRRHFKGRTADDPLEHLDAGGDDPRAAIEAKIYVARLLPEARSRLTTPRAQRVFDDMFVHPCSDEEIMSRNGLNRRANVHLWRFKLIAHLREVARDLDD